ncbi:MAG: WHG domain-containing protein [Alphaproteobacteria bacterium]|nr:MAG: WHG domain-containing protein [Alphaproteobacteria bacterium]
MAKRSSAPRTRVRPAAKRAVSAGRGGKRKPLRDFGANPDAPYAAVGFRQFNAAMVAAGAIGVSPLEKALARAKAYVAYAQAHPGMYGLMFRTERLDMSRPSLCEAANASFAGLAGTIAATRQEQISDRTLSLEQAADIARAWSLVHGFTTLLLDGRLTDIMERLPKDTSAEALLDAMLKRAIGHAPVT